MFNRKVLTKSINLITYSANNLRFAKHGIQTKSVAELIDLDLTDNKPLEDELSKTEIRLVGWVKSFRDQKEIKFLHLNDGASTSSLQLVFLPDKQKDKTKDFKNIFKSISFNSTIEVTGVVVKSKHPKQNVELQITDLSLISPCDPNAYPFKANTKYSLEQIRPYIHLRGHVDLFAYILRFRSRLTMSIHEFFFKNQFTQIHTPIITSNNCEGGCETFQVTSNDQDTSFTQNSENLRNQMEKSTGNNSSLLENVSDEQLKHFFSKPGYLTASAQLHLETMTSALGNVYTLSPIFRAEKSMTRHHLAEFYMLEAELIDMKNLDQLLAFVEKFVKDVSLNTYENFNKVEMNLILSGNQAGKNKNKQNAEEQLRHVEILTDSLKKKRFQQITYTEAVKVLNKILTSNQKLSKTGKKKIEFGDDMNKEQEKILVEYFENTPVFVTNYPQNIKPFYMRQSKIDPNLVDNFDLLAPYVGEIVGGSLRENNVELLECRMRERNLDMNLFEHYLETKRFGAMKMGGFGLGLERLVQFLANIENIRDTCAFPRSLYNCKM